MTTETPSPMSLSERVEKLSGASRKALAVATDWLGHCWRRSVPLLLCVVGGAIWKAQDGWSGGLALFLAAVVWTFALDLIASRAEAREKSLYGAKLAAMVMDDHQVEIEVRNTHTYFADEATRAACRDTLTAIEFTLEDESQSEDEGEMLPFALVVSRADSVDSHTINCITLELARLARENQGRYDGWQCTVTREAS